MDLERHELISMTRSIWESLVGLELNDLVGTSIPDHPESVLTACVHITGKSRCTVIVECVHPLARRAAESMLQISSTEVTDDDASDALGEFANVLAGHVKAMSFSQCGLSCPIVVRGEHFKVLLPASELRLQIALENDGHVVSVSVFQPMDAKTAEDHRNARVV